MDKKNKSYTYAVHKDSLEMERNRLKINGQEKIFHKTGNEKKR